MNPRVYFFRQLFLLIAATLIAWAIAPGVTGQEPSLGEPPEGVKAGLPLWGRWTSGEFLTLIPGQEWLWGAPKSPLEEAPEFLQAAIYDGPNGYRPAPAPNGRPLKLYTNPMVKRLIRFYTEERRSQIERGYRRAGRYLPMIRRIFAEAGIPVELAYLSAVESNFNPKARSPAHAVGMWQFTAATARIFGMRMNPPWYDERRDPETSTHAAARLLGYLFDRFGNWEHALAAYNAGEGRVFRDIARNKRRGKPTDYWSLPLPRQTRGFVPAFLAIAHVMGNPARYGLDQLERDPPLRAEALEMKISGSLEDIAQRLSLPLDRLTRLNPAWKGRVIPHFKMNKVVLWVPQGKMSRLMVSYRKEPPAPIKWVVHKIREGETLYHMARYYKVRVRDILNLNGMNMRSMVLIGTPLLVPLPADGYRDVPPPPMEKLIPENHETPAMAQLHLHKVSNGESFWTISRKYGVRLRDLQRWNVANVERGMLYPSQELVVFLSR